MIRALFSIFIMVLFGASVAWGDSKAAETVTPCPVDSIPIQIMFAGKHYDVTSLSAANLDYSTPVNKYFSYFVKDVTEYLATRLAQEKLCFDSAESMKNSKLQFVEWHLDLWGPPKSVPPLEVRPLGVCRISSPWIELVVEREPVPSVRGIVRYNERQLLADQAVLAGAQNVPPGVAMPITGKEFRQYADLEYLPSEILHKPADKPIEERVPPDILWLLRRARQDERPGRFSGTAGSSMSKAMKEGAEGYTKIVISLIDRCFESDGLDIKLNSILDLDDPDLFEQYKIDKSIVSMPEVEN